MQEYFDDHSAEKRREVRHHRCKSQFSTLPNKTQVAGCKILTFLRTNKRISPKTFQTRNVNSLTWICNEIHRSHAKMRQILRLAFVLEYYSTLTTLAEIHQLNVSVHLYWSVLCCFFVHLDLFMSMRKACVLSARTSAHRTNSLFGRPIPITRVRNAMQFEVTSFTNQPNPFLHFNLTSHRTKSLLRGFKQGLNNEITLDSWGGKNMSQRFLRHRLLGNFSCSASLLKKLNP